MRENTVILHGQVYGVPKIFINEDNEFVKARFFIKTIRRFGSNKGMGDNFMRFDFPMIVSYEKDIIKKIKELGEGDMVDIKGVTTTYNVVKKRRCPDCENIEKDNGVLNCITPLYVCKREEGLDEQQGFELLKERNEISNNAYIMGTVISDVNFYEDDKMAYSQYQMIVGRKYHIKTDLSDRRVDFPFIKSYGDNGRNDNKMLRKGSHIFISASVSTREFSRQYCCSKCNKIYEKKDTALEFTPYSIEYLDDKTDEYEEQEELL